MSSEDDFWRRQRRLAQPAFHRQRLAALAESMSKAAQDLGEHWRAYLTDGRPFELSEQMTRVTLQIVEQALLSTDLTDEQDALRRDLLLRSNTSTIG